MADMTTTLGMRAADTATQAPAKIAIEGLDFFYGKSQAL